jgi:hypothetical protein
VVECHSILEFKKMRQNQQQTFFKRVTLFLVKSDLCQKIQKSAALLHCTALLHCCTAALLHCCTAALLHCCTAALLLMEFLRERKPRQNRQLTQEKSAPLLTLDISGEALPGFCLKGLHC